METATAAAPTTTDPTARTLPTISNTFKNNRVKNTSDKANAELNNNSSSRNTAVNVWVYE